MIEPLNNCPCCHSRMIHITHDEGAFIVICEECDMQGPAMAQFREAIEQWNRLKAQDIEATMGVSAIPTLTEQQGR